MRNMRSEVVPIPSHRRIVAPTTSFYFRPISRITCTRKTTNASCADFTVAGKCQKPAYLEVSIGDDQGQWYGYCNAGQYIASKPLLRRPSRTLHTCTMYFKNFKPLLFNESGCSRPKRKHGIKKYTICTHYHGRLDECIFVMPYCFSEQSSRAVNYWRCKAFLRSVSERLSHIRSWLRCVTITTQEARLGTLKQRLKSSNLQKYVEYLDLADSVGWRQYSSTSNGPGYKGELIGTKDIEDGGRERYVWWTRRLRAGVSVDSNAEMKQAVQSANVSRTRTPAKWRHLPRTCRQANPQSQRLVICSPAGNRANIGNLFAALICQSDTRLVPQPSRSQSENFYVRIKRAATPFHLQRAEVSESAAPERPLAVRSQVAAVWRQVGDRPFFSSPRSLNTRGVGLLRISCLTNSSLLVSSSLLRCNPSAKFFHVIFERRIIAAVQLFPVPTILACPGPSQDARPGGLLVVEFAKYVVVRGVGNSLHRTTFLLATQMRGKTASVLSTFISSCSSGIRPRADEKQTAAIKLSIGFLGYGSLWDLTVVLSAVLYSGFVKVRSKFVPSDSMKVTEGRLLTSRCELRKRSKCHKLVGSFEELGILIVEFNGASFGHAGVGEGGALPLVHEIGKGEYPWLSPSSVVCVCAQLWRISTLSVDCVVLRLEVQDWPPPGPEWWCLKECCWCECWGGMTRYGQGSKMAARLLLFGKNKRLCELKPSPNTKLRDGVQPQRRRHLQAHTPAKWRHLPVICRQSAPRNLLVSWQPIQDIQSSLLRTQSAKYSGLYQSDTRPVSRPSRSRPACVYIHIKGTTISSSYVYLLRGNCSGVVVRLSASHVGEPSSFPGGVAPGFSNVGIVQDDDAGRRVFADIFPTLHSGAAPYVISPSSALKNSVPRTRRVSNIYRAPASLSIPTAASHGVIRVLDAPVDFSTLLRCVLSRFSAVMSDEPQDSVCVIIIGHVGHSGCTFSATETTAALSLRVLLRLNTGRIEARYEYRTQVMSVTTFAVPSAEASGLSWIAANEKQGRCDVRSTKLRPRQPENGRFCFYFPSLGLVEARGNCKSNIIKQNLLPAEATTRIDVCVCVCVDAASRLSGRHYPSAYHDATRAAAVRGRAHGVPFVPGLATCEYTIVATSPPPHMKPSTAAATHKRDPVTWNRQSNDTHKTPYDRVKRCRERKINSKASERVNVDVFTENKRPGTALARISHATKVDINETRRIPGLQAVGRKNADTREKNEKEGRAVYAGLFQKGSLYREQSVVGGRAYLGDTLRRITGGHLFSTDVFVSAFPRAVAAPSRNYDPRENLIKLVLAVERIQDDKLVTRNKKGTLLANGTGEWARRSCAMTRLVVDGELLLSVYSPSLCSPSLLLVASDIAEVLGITISQSAVSVSWPAPYRLFTVNSWYSLKLPSKEDNKKKLQKSSNWLGQRRGEGGYVSVLVPDRCRKTPVAGDHACVGESRGVERAGEGQATDEGHRDNTPQEVRKNVKEEGLTARGSRLASPHHTELAPASALPSSSDAGPRLRSRVARRRPPPRPSERRLLICSRSPITASFLRQHLALAAARAVCILPRDDRFVTMQFVAAKAQTFTKIVLEATDRSAVGTTFTVRDTIADTTTSNSSIAGYFTVNCLYMQSDENTASQFRAVRLEAMAHVMRVPVSPLSLPRFSASNARRNSRLGESLKSSDKDNIFRSTPKKKNISVSAHRIAAGPHAQLAISAALTRDYARIAIAYPIERDHIYFDRDISPEVIRVGSDRPAKVKKAFSVWYNARIGLILKTLEKNMYRLFTVKRALLKALLKIYLNARCVFFRLMRQILQCSALGLTLHKRAQKADRVSAASSLYNVFLNVCSELCYVIPRVERVRKLITTHSQKDACGTLEWIGNILSACANESGSFLRGLRTKRISSICDKLVALVLKAASKYAAFAGGKANDLQTFRGVHASFKTAAEDGELMDWLVDWQSTRTSVKTVAEYVQTVDLLACPFAACLNAALGTRPVSKWLLRTAKDFLLVRLPLIDVRRPCMLLDNKPSDEAQCVDFPQANKAFFCNGNYESHLDKVVTIVSLRTCISTGLLLVMRSRIYGNESCTYRRRLNVYLDAYALETLASCLGRNRSSKLSFFGRNTTFSFIIITTIIKQQKKINYIDIVIIGQFEDLYWRKRPSEIDNGLAFEKETAPLHAMACHFPDEGPIPTGQLLLDLEVNLEVVDDCNLQFSAYLRHVQCVSVLSERGTPVLQLRVVLTSRAAPRRAAGAPCRPWRPLIDRLLQLGPPEPHCQPLAAASHHLPPPLTINIPTPSHPFVNVTLSSSSPRHRLRLRNREVPKTRSLLPVVVKAIGACYRRFTATHGQKQGHYDGNRKQRKQASRVFCFLIIVHQKTDPRNLLVKPPSRRWKQVIVRNGVWKIRHVLARTYRRSRIPRKTQPSGLCNSSQLESVEKKSGEDRQRKVQRCTEIWFQPSTPLGGGVALHALKMNQRTGPWNLLAKPPLAKGHRRVVVRLLASRQHGPDLITVWVAPPPPEFSHEGTVSDDAAGRRVFSWLSRLPRPCIPALLHTHLASPPSALKTSISIAALTSSPTVPPHSSASTRFDPCNGFLSVLITGRCRACAIVASSFLFLKDGFFDEEAGPMMVRAISHEWLTLTFSPKVDLVFKTFMVAPVQGRKFLPDSLGNLTNIMRLQTVRVRLHIVILCPVVHHLSKKIPMMEATSEFCKLPNHDSEPKVNWVARKDIRAVGCCQGARSATEPGAASSYLGAARPSCDTRGPVQRKLRPYTVLSCSGEKETRPSQRHEMQIDIEHIDCLQSGGDMEAVFPPCCVSNVASVMHYVQVLSLSTIRMLRIFFRKHAV
ncbi:hypothetical protein PR048_000923 [Dryococelus australis]|uniref:Uncharacterized protein n=1 Tax=Dryococelus australis TaxID=614101 RepID=A0ABQ9IFZ3_9NEOP|nr:hypothetical protein PR048_000923 [Dryococelus australis]